MTGPLRVLIVDDVPTDAKLIAHALKRNWAELVHERVEEADTMRDALGRVTWDVIICDWSMPRFSALDALALVEELSLDIPFIIVSGTIGEESAVEAMRAGAHDYVLKDKLGRLVPAVQRELRECSERAARRRVEQALVTSEARFNRLFESGIIGILVSDLSGSVSMANDAFLNMIGYSRDDLLAGRVCWAALQPKDWEPEAMRATEEIRATGVARPFEMEGLRRDGSRFPVLVGVATLTATESIVFAVDLTERRASEEERRRLATALQRTEEQLRHAQKMEAVGRLAGGVAHDFNNLLSVVLSYCALAMDDLRPEDPVREDVKQIQRAGERAADLTNQLMAFSRQHVLEPQIIDLNVLLDEMSKMVRRLVGEDVDVRIIPSPRLGKIKADPGHLEQVIMNLVVNARDAMHRGGALTIETEMVELDAAYAEAHIGVTPGPHVMLAVTDTGTGIPKAIADRIFEPFFTTKELGKGTGLGLSTVFGIVRQSGGTIWVYSEEGHGTTFKVFFPCTEEAPHEKVVPAPSGSLRGSEAVLLVEDEEQVRVVVRGILLRNGYRVIEATSSEEAVELCERLSDHIDLLLTDVVMPRLSGPELAAKVLVLRPTLRVLFMSGYTENAIAYRRVLTPGTTLLQKPITPDLLLRKVRQVLDQR